MSGQWWATGVITMADLLSRYAPDPMVEPAAPVSVESLLRREGHAGSAVLHVSDGAHADDDSAAARRPTERIVRRAAVAAGLLVAAGSVFGALAVTHTAPAEFEAPRASGGDDPGAGRLDPQQGPDDAIPVVVDPAAQTDTLDPGDGAPTSWMRTAFPSSGPAASGPAPASTPAVDREQAPTGPAGRAVQGPSAAGDGPDGGGATDRDTPGDDNAAADGNDSNDEAPEIVDDSGTDTPERPDGAVGGLVQDVGGVLPEPLGSPVTSLGSTVAGLL